MGLSPGLDFETRLFYKEDAAGLLEKQLSRKSYVCKPITLGANTDPYQPVERRMQVTRSILEVLARTHHPVTIITKSALVLRDLDLLTQLAREGLASVAVSITSLDAELKRTLEPRAASPQARLRTVAGLSAAGVPSAVHGGAGHPGAHRPRARGNPRGRGGGGRDRGRATCCCGCRTRSRTCLPSGWPSTTRSARRT